MGQKTNQLVFHFNDQCNLFHVTNFCSWNQRQIQAVRQTRNLLEGTRRYTKVLAFIKFSENITALNNFVTKLL